MIGFCSSNRYKLFTEQTIFYGHSKQHFCIVLTAKHCDNTEEKSCKLQIVIADDFRILVDRFKKLLASQPDIIVVADTHSIATALLHVERLCPDVIIVDIQLEGSEPKQAIAFLNVLQRTYPNLTIIVFTNLADSRYRELCQMNGADYFFDKACGTDAISETLEEILQLKRTLAKLN